MSELTHARQKHSAVLMGILVVGLSLATAPRVAGQGGGNPAGIAGVVMDNTKAVLPGVTVTAIHESTGTFADRSSTPAGSGGTVGVTSTGADGCAMIIDGTACSGPVVGRSRT